MSYIASLINGNTKSLSEMLKTAIEGGHITTDSIRNALEAEAAPVPAGGDIYNLTTTSQEFIRKLAGSPDRDMLIIVKKLLRSTKYAATTYYSMVGLDQNPHNLPLPFVAEAGAKVAVP